MPSSSLGSEARALTSGPTRASKGGPRVLAPLVPIARATQTGLYSRSAAQSVRRPSGRQRLKAPSPPHERNILTSRRSFFSRSLGARTVSSVRSRKGAECAPHSVTQSSMKPLAWS